MIRISAFLALLIGLQAVGKEPIRLPNNPALSPDGKVIAFDWDGDIWTVPAEGGVAKPLTAHDARDTSPKFSPDGKEIAFVSIREGTPQVFVIPATGGAPTQVTFHTAGYTLYEWTPDGKGFLVGTSRDHGWPGRSNARVQIAHRPEGDKRKADTLLFDDYAANATLSADGRRVYFTREGPEWWRKDYSGSQVSQVWSYDREAKTFERIGKTDADRRWPMVGKNGAVFCAENRGGVFNIVEQNNGGKPSTTYTDDAAVFPCISRDGGTIVYRQLFDLYRIDAGGAKPAKVEIFRDDDRPDDRKDRRVVTSATAAAFTADGLEVAIIAGGDVWVMDTELREPRRITHTPEEEREVIFSPDGQSLLFVSDQGGKPEIWKATRDGKKPWFLTEKFKVEPVTTDGEEKSRLSFSPDSSKLAYLRGRGDLYVANADGKEAKRVLASWNAPQYDWSPDGKWMVYAVSDNDFNRDVWVMPLDGSKPAFNLSRHPYNESSPVWSPDGKLIAFVGDRDRKETSDILYVWLRAQDDEKSTRDRTLEKALEKFQKGKGPMPRKEPGAAGDADDEPKKEEPAAKKADMVGKKEPVTVSIDFEGIRDRIRRVSIPNSNEGNLLWSPDSKKLAFTANVEGQSGTYTIEIPQGIRPTLLTSSTGGNARWLKNGTIVWLSRGLPTAVSAAGGASAPTPSPAAATTPRGPGGGRAGGGGATPPAAGDAGGYRFTVYQDIDLGKKHQAAFDMAWRTMRDNWYDERLNNRDWNLVREKYRAAADTPDEQALGTVVQMMLGELNGSHLGFTVGSLTRPPSRGPGGPPDEPAAEQTWRPTTMHLGVRFDPAFAGPGLKVKDVLPDGPADQTRSKLKAGDVILSIDGKDVDPTIDLSTVTTVGPNHEFRLKVKDSDGKDRDVTLRPTAFAAARNLLYRKWLADNRAKVDKLSGGTLGYLHISAMDQQSFVKFEEELYDAGAGKEGLVIDVRENGGGSTADHLLTALTQPRHAIAVPRGGGPGYPQDRTVYATWNKPIVVLCNQNSFSNAEIFSHAVKTLKRGKVVGVPTAGGVISTGGTSIMDVGFLRMPFRGWFLVDDGEDMERHGAVPDVVVWPQPGDLATGTDRQIETAVKELAESVKEWKARPQPKLLKASERK